MPLVFGVIAWPNIFICPIELRIHMYLFSRSLLGAKIEHPKWPV